MELAVLLPYLLLLACPIGMGLMMWMMNRNMGGHTGQATPPTPMDRLAALREQRQALEAEIDEMTRIVALEQERERALAAAPSGHPPVSAAVADAARSATVEG